jgi:signal transduction histidine kinase
MRTSARERSGTRPEEVLEEQPGTETGAADASVQAERNTAWVTYVSLVSLAGVGLVPFMLASPRIPAALGSAGFWLFSVFVLLGEMFPLRVQMRDELTENTTSVTFSFALIIAFGAGAAVIPNILASAIGDVRQGKSPLRVVFNVGQYVLSIAACGAVYSVLDGATTIGAADIPAIAAAALTMFLVNLVLTSIAVGLWQRLPLLPYIYKNIVFSAHMTPALLALSPVVVVVADVSLWFVPLFAIPIAAVYWGMTKALENSRLVDRLRDSLEQMTELNRMKDDFVAVVSHELRTPLTSIQGYVKTLLQLAGQLDEAQERSFLEAADRQSDRLRSLIEQLLVVGRLETHSEPLAATRVSLASVARNVIEELRPRAHGHAFDLRFDPDTPVVETDEHKVHQILSNLVENALKYSPPDTRITIRIESRHDGIVVAVQDEGHGIPVDAREQVFERFYQVDSSATRSVGGTGLGLYICRKMAEQLGARIWLESSGRRGSTFCLFVPFSPPSRRDRVPGAEADGEPATCDQSITASV